MSSGAPYLEADVSTLVLPSDRYTLVSALQSQEYGDTSEPYDVADLAFTVSGRPGVFTVQIPLSSFRIFESGIDLSSEADIVDELYGL